MDFDDPQFWYAASWNEAFLEFIATEYSFVLFQSKLADNLYGFIFVPCPEDTSYPDQDQNHPANSPTCYVFPQNQPTKTDSSTSAAS
jgi:hypothetical protein